VLGACKKDEKIDEASVKMQDFVVNISNYARGFDSDFIIIPQNGIELAYLGTDPSLGINETYLNAISGIGVEELFFMSDRLEDDGRLSMLQPLKTRAKVMVADFVSSDEQWFESVTLSRNEGFISFPRSASNYDYKEIPSTMYDLSYDTITTLAEARNYLYLISTDNFATKESMCEAIRATRYDVVLIDPYFNEEPLSTADVASLKNKDVGGTRLVIAYINIGAAESWRYYWQDDWKLHKPDWLAKKYDGYDDEIWVEFWNQEWQDIIYGNDVSYIKKIIDMGFDGVYLDNVEAYYFLYDN
jgi:cysteinyl-tRNA synthetase